MTSTKAALYARVSTTDHDQDPEVQLLQLRKFAELRGWAVHNEYIDTCSGRTPERPALKLLKNDAKSGSFNLILVLRIDRIMRSVAHFYNLADELEHSGVRIVTCDGIDFSTPVGRLIRGILLDVAQFEAELLITRTKEGLEKARAAGRTIGRPSVDVNIEELLQLLEAGVSKGKISKMLGCSHATINNRLRAAGREDLVASPTPKAAKRGMLGNRSAVKYEGTPDGISNNRSVVAGEAVED